MFTLLLCVLLFCFVVYVLPFLIALVIGVAPLVIGVLSCLWLIHAIL